MSKSKKVKDEKMGHKLRDDVLTKLLASTPAAVLRVLVLQLANGRPDVRRECFQFLKKHVTISEELESKSEGEIILSLWAELEPDLSDLDSYGGGDYDTQDYVDELLYEICEHLHSKKIDSDSRLKLLNSILPYIKSGNAGMDDMLHEVAYAACYDDSDMRGLAKAFEAMDNDWKIHRAREIYRELGDREKYLELRRKRMVYGRDYHDLAAFYWESGEEEIAIQTAEEGLRKGEGRLDELREFLSNRAKETGDRERYLALQFEQTTDNISLEKYKAFQKLCTAEEWSKFEPKIITSLKDSWQSEHLRIRIHRKEYDKALEILSRGRYPIFGWEGEYELEVAEKLKRFYPEEILKYYLSGLGNLNSNATRKEYARKASVMAKIRRVLVDVLNDYERWKTFAQKIKNDNNRRPAFQEEFAGAIPDWKELHCDAS